jgi:hypothetical protein
MSTPRSACRTSGKNRRSAQSVHYLNHLEKYVDVETLTWKPVRPGIDGEPRGGTTPAATERGLDITGAKKALSLFYRVPVAAIEIVIRG